MCSCWLLLLFMGCVLRCWLFVLVCLVMLGCVFVCLFVFGLFSCLLTLCLWRFGCLCYWIFICCVAVLMFVLGLFVVLIVYVAFRLVGIMVIGFWLFMIVNSVDYVCLRGLCCILVDFVLLDEFILVWVGLLI